MEKIVIDNKEKAIISIAESLHKISEEGLKIKFENKLWVIK